MAEFSEVVKISKRICGMRTECSGCVLDGYCIDIYKIRDAENFERIVMEWASDHECRSHLFAFVFSHQFTSILMPVSFSSSTSIFAK